MQKSRLGISIGLLGAIFFFACFFGGYIPTILLAGYILLVEESAWLKRITVKGVVLMITFSVIAALINFIPNIMGFIDDIARIFNGNVYLPVVNNIVNVLLTALNLVEKVLFLLLGFKALKQETVIIAPVDALVSKYMD